MIVPCTDPGIEIADQKAETGCSFRDEISDKENKTMASIAREEKKTALLPGGVRWY